MSPEAKPQCQTTARSGRLVGAGRFNHDINRHIFRHPIGIRVRALPQVQRGALEHSLAGHLSLSAVDLQSEWEVRIDRDVLQREAGGRCV